jgi:class 3 adenylate cyclase
MIDVAGNIDAIGVPAEHDRFVTTLLLTDIVDSTRRANSLGDLGWKQVLADHNRLVRDAFVRFRGNEVNTTGDGFLATFSSAVAALRCANLIRTALAGIGLEVRIGIHTGEIEHAGSDIRGIAVHAAARIMALAAPSQVLVSSATRALADGSGLEFRDEGSHAIKGFDRPVEVFELVT